MAGNQGIQRDSFANSGKVRRMTQPPRNHVPGGFDNGSLARRLLAYRYGESEASCKRPHARPIFWAHRSAIDTMYMPLDVNFS